MCVLTSFTRLASSWLLCLSLFLLPFCSAATSACARSMVLMPHATPCAACPPHNPAASLAAQLICMRTYTFSTCLVATLLQLLSLPLRAACSASLLPPLVQQLRPVRSHSDARGCSCHR